MTSVRVDGAMRRAGDNVVPFGAGERLRDMLKERGFAVTWFPVQGMAHSSSQGELQALLTFFQHALDPPKPHAECD